MAIEGPEFGMPTTKELATPEFEKRCTNESQPETSEDNMVKNTSICAAMTFAAFLWLGNVKPAAAQDDNKQVAELYQLQAAYHRVATVRDPVNGDSRR